MTTEQSQDQAADRRHALELTAEEVAYVRNRKEQDERALWAWKLIRANAPWLAAIAGGLGTLVYWFLTHTVTIDKR